MGTGVGTRTQTTVLQVASSTITMKMQCFKKFIIHEGYNHFVLHHPNWSCASFCATEYTLLPSSGSSTVWYKCHRLNPHISCVQFPLAQTGFHLLATSCAPYVQPAPVATTTNASTLEMEAAYSSKTLRRS